MERVAGPSKAVPRAIFAENGVATLATALRRRAKAFHYLLSVQRKRSIKQAFMQSFLFCRFTCLVRDTSNLMTPRR